MKKITVKTIVILIFVVTLFFSYPVNMSRENKEYVQEQLEDMAEKQSSGIIAFAQQACQS